MWSARLPPCVERWVLDLLTLVGDAGAPVGSGGTCGCEHVALEVHRERSSRGWRVTGVSAAHEAACPLSLAEYVAHEDGEGGPRD